MDIIDAIECNDIEFITKNLGKFDPDQKGKYGYPLLHRAAYLGHLEAMQILIDNGANIDIFDEDRFTPLHSIIDGNENNWYDCIELLIKNGANVNSYMSWKDSNESESKESILITSVKEEVWIKVIELLLENGADVDFVDSDGKKASDYALNSNYDEAFILIRKYPKVDKNDTKSVEKFFDNGTKVRITYIKDRRELTKVNNILFEVFYPNGNIKCVIPKRGRISSGYNLLKTNGLVKAYYRNGNIAEEIFFKDNIPQYGNYYLKSGLSKKMTSKHLSKIEQKHTKNQANINKFNNDNSNQKYM